MISVLQNQNRLGDWIQTYTGKAFWPFDARPDEVDIEDIAHSLSLQCRYGGHCKYFYSVAEHSVYVSQLCSPENALWGLLHDATEAYLCDLPRPIKWHIPEYKRIEARLEIVIANALGLSLPMPDEIKQIDNAILLCERNQLMSKPPYDWQIEIVKPVNIMIECWEPRRAKVRFTERYYYLLSRGIG